MLNFGTGALVGMRNDISGQTPVQFAALQGVDADFSFSEKPLMGTNQFPILVARGEAKWSLKAKSASIKAKLFNSIFFAQALATGQILLAKDEPHIVPASSPYVVTPNNSATWLSDQGVTYGGPLGLDLTKVLTAPSASAQYEPAASGYTVSSSDASALVLLNYLYSVTTGETITLTNQALGNTPTFSGVFRNRDPQTGLFTTLVINKMTCSKLTLGSKTSDWTIPEMDMTIMDDGSGNIGTLSFGDVS